MPVLLAGAYHTGTIIEGPLLLLYLQFCTESCFQLYFVYGQGTNGCCAWSSPCHVFSRSREDLDGGGHAYVVPPIPSDRGSDGEGGSGGDGDGDGGDDGAGDGGGDGGGSGGGGGEGDGGGENPGGEAAAKRARDTGGNRNEVSTDVLK